MMFYNIGLKKHLSHISFLKVVVFGTRVGFSYLHTLSVYKFVLNFWVLIVVRSATFQYITKKHVRSISCQSHRYNTLPL